MAKRRPLRVREGGLTLDGIIVNKTAEDINLVDDCERVRAVFLRNDCPTRVIMDATAGRLDLEDWEDRNDCNCKMCGAINTAIPLMRPTKVPENLRNRWKGYMANHLLQIREAPSLAVACRGELRTYYIVTLETALAMLYGGDPCCLEYLLVPVRALERDGGRLGYRGLMPARFLGEG